MELTVFEQKYVSQFKQLSELKKEMDRLAAIDKQVRAELEEAMINNDIISVKNDYVTISRVKGSESVSIDLKALEVKEPDLYNELLTDYPKKTVKKDSIRIVVK